MEKLRVLGACRMWLTEDDADEVLRKAHRKQRSGAPAHSCLIPLAELQDQLRPCFALEQTSAKLEEVLEENRGFLFRDLDLEEFLYKSAWH